MKSSFFFLLTEGTSRVRPDFHQSEVSAWPVSKPTAFTIYQEVFYHVYMIISVIIWCPGDRLQCCCSTTMNCELSIIITWWTIISAPPQHAAEHHEIAWLMAYLFWSCPPGSYMTSCWTVNRLVLSLNILVSDGLLCNIGCFAYRIRV